MMIQPSNKSFAADIGFTPDKFRALSYLWRNGKVITVSAIACVDIGKGNFSQLLNTLWGKGFTVKIPTPLGIMEHIVRKKGFTHTTEEDGVMGPVEMWVKSPTTPQENA